MTSTQPNPAPEIKAAPNLPLDVAEAFDEFMTAFDAFKETGDAFDPAMSAKLSTHIYSAGGSKEADTLYKSFRGSMPSVEALLKGRGLDAA